MVKEELNQKSPLRKLEAINNGGVGAGNIGVIASKQGIGKTAYLVHLSVDSLLRNKHVIHVSFDKKTDYISAWYEDIFTEISRKRHLESAMEVHDEMIHNRIIMNFHHNYPIDKCIEAISAMIDSGQNGTDLVIIDGYDFNRGSIKEIDKIKAFAVDKKVEVWFSDTYYANSLDDDGVPKNLNPFIYNFKTILTLAYEGDVLKLSVAMHNSEIKDTGLCLDPKTLLIC
ncbi:AAA family ATPase [Candidatus Bathyarchaeota archaeon]|nr:AAA family ATPase [Candidatus Bathyarchaeota archaeon]MBN2617131.1 AAA family ATPase [Spirochaetales bacterium]